MIYLGVNIDHIATIRQQRGTRYPSVVQAALLAEQAGPLLDARGRPGDLLTVSP